MQVFSSLGLQRDVLEPLVYGSVDLKCSQWQRVVSGHCCKYLCFVKTRESWNNLSFWCYGAVLTYQQLIIFESYELYPKYCNILSCCNFWGLYYNVSPWASVQMQQYNIINKQTNEMCCVYRTNTSWAWHAALHTRKQLTVIIINPE